MAKTTYVSQINGAKLAAERAQYTWAGDNIDSKFAEIEQEITSMGSFEVVPLTSGDHPVPDVTDPSTKIIYLTKESGSSKTDPYTEWIYIAGTPSGTWEVIGETSIDLSGKADKVTNATADNFAGLNASGNLTDSGYKASDFKTKQTAVEVQGGALKAVSSFTQNANGEASLTLTDIQDGTTSQKGVVQLQGSIGASESEDGKAATPKSVRDAINDLDVTAVTVGASKTLASISETDGKISASAVDIQIAESQVTNLVDDLASKQDNLSFEGTYDASTNKVATESTVSDAIDALDVSAISVGADKTLTSISETDGKISATPVSIQIAESQVTNLTTDLAAKADKVTSATSGNFAGLDSNGNLTDSGSKASDFATSAQGAKADSAIQGVKVSGTALTPDANKVVDVPAAIVPTSEGTAGAYGVVSIGVALLDEIPST